MQITLLGTGAMGSRMALALLKAGHRVTVWNRTATRTEALLERGAILARTPAAAVAQADVAISMVRDDAASREVWLAEHDGALDRLPTSGIAIESSTLSVAWVRELSANCSKRNISFLDAPVVGSRAQADAAQLIYLVGGEASVVARAAPVLAVMGQASHHVGETGTATSLKLLVNAMLGVQVALLGELLAAAPRLGLDLARTVDILAQTPPCSPAAKVAATAMLARSFAPAFPVELMEKDLSYLLSTASHATMPVTAAARTVFARASEADLSTENMTAVAKLYC